MKISTTILVFLASTVAAIWPAPRTYHHGNETLWIDPHVKVIYSQPRHVSNVQINSDLESNAPEVHVHHLNACQDEPASIVQTAIQSTYETLFHHNFIPWKFHPRFSSFEPSLSNMTFITSISLKQLLPDPSSDDPNSISTDESHTLTLTFTGTVIITANTSIGLAHALTTFTQLFYAHSLGGIYTPYAPATITDRPSFPHRGLNLDVARNFFPVPSILHTIDALAYNKFNRLHLHITDAQSWPLEIPALPTLSARGAYGPNFTYAPADLATLQRHARLRGVQVYLEIDMPGHTSSVAHAFPALVAAYNVQPDWAAYCAEPPCGTLKLNSSAVYVFLDALWADVLPRVARGGARLMHTGGDEVNFAAYTLDDTVRSSDPQVLRALLQVFVDFNHDRVRAAGLVPVVWEEMLLVYNLTLGRDVVVQAWRGVDSVRAIVERGFQALVGSVDLWYLDCGQGQWLDFNPGASAQTSYPYADYCSPTKNWHLIYTLDPLASIPPSRRHLVLGGEAHMWTEQTDAVSLDGVLWPRACAAAEVLWSDSVSYRASDNVSSSDNDNDNNNNNTNPRSQIEAAPRLAEMRERLVARGVRAGAQGVGMPFCRMDGAMCVL